MGMKCWVSDGTHVNLESLGQMDRMGQGMCIYIYIYIHPSSITASKQKKKNVGVDWT